MNKEKTSTVEVVLVGFKCEKQESSLVYYCRLGPNLSLKFAMTREFNGHLPISLSEEPPSVKVRMTNLHILSPIALTLPSAKPMALDAAVGLQVFFYASVFVSISL
jgi:hypothetical protein